MKQIWLFLAAALGLMLLPGGTDAAKLAPAQVVCVQTAEGIVTVRTDFGNMGSGRDLSEAFKDLENTTPGKVFLDTADYLLVDETSVRYLQELGGWLKGDCLVCLGKEIKDLPGAADYLDAHPPRQKLKDCRGDEVVLPHLTEMDERFCLKG